MKSGHKFAALYLRAYSFQVFGRVNLYFEIKAFLKKGKDLLHEIKGRNRMKSQGETENMSGDQARL